MCRVQDLAVVFEIARRVLQWLGNLKDALWQVVSKLIKSGELEVI